MSVLVNTKVRTSEIEIMDDFSIEGDILNDTLDKLAGINRWLGGNKVTLKGVKKLLHNQPKDKPLTLVDLGCGGGDILRDIADFGRKKGLTFQLIGVDANANVLDYATQLSQDYPEISFLHYDIFSEEFKSLEYDIVITTLFLHHFSETQIEQTLSSILNKVTLGVVINDLQRSALAYYLFRLLCVVITNNQMVIQDGLTSVLRGFKRNELVAMSRVLGVKPQIHWRWAFRYLWVIQKNT
jgi:2-polyprenyl-3-methyl-5-hydroxy-6-metoxy-1,4-benzoquinol methylase